MPPYPPSEPFQQGMLAVDGGHEIYWEVCGNRAGIPAVVLHGGPGSGCTPGFRRFFDPNAYRLVLFDQRNCGRSTPHASDPRVSLATNTTHHLITDIEQLREHLGIEQWLVYGGSWGSTLALAYAERSPERVRAMVLAAVTNTGPDEIAWLYHGVGRYFPEQWERFRDGVPAADRSGDLVEAYARLLEHPEAAVREKAAADWCEWEDEVVKLDPKAPPNPRYADPQFRMAFARIVTHYFRHNAWLEPGQLLRDAHRLRGIPGVLIHGRLDLGGPLQTAWDLHKAWPGSDLIAVDSGHLSSEPGMVEAILATTDRFARELG